MSDDEWTEIRSWDGKALRLVRPPCRHSDAVPVESVTSGEVLAHLCVTCDAQLPAEWRVDRSTRDTSWPATATPAELGRALAAVAPPISDAQALEAARILASDPGDNR